jgi:hypothetical protein
LTTPGSGVPVISCILCFIRSNYKPEGMKCVETCLGKTDWSWQRFIHPYGVCNLWVGLGIKEVPSDIPETGSGRSVFRKASISSGVRVKKTDRGRAIRSIHMTVNAIVPHQGE